MAFAASTACRPSLLLPPRQRSSRPLLCTPSTAAFRRGALSATTTPTPARAAPPSTTGRNRIVCGKVTTTNNYPSSCRSRRSTMMHAAAWLLLQQLSPAAARVARAADDDSSVQVSKGSAAPNFTLRDQDGRAVSLSKFKGRPVVVYFYPADETPGCTKQACAFRDSYEKFKKAGAEVIGISGDDAASHKEFKKKYKLPFTLLSDEGNKVRKEWGVPADLFGTLPGRQTYVLDKNGVVQYIYNNQFQPEKHIGETLKILQSL
uniref:thioredoxin-dependent peroxiredoxin n=1 Tax=Oryza glumipatula TaxID=40148 RepID=A0A0E0A6A0_9ORYZ